MAATANYTSVAKDGGVVFLIEPARGSIALLVLALGFAAVCGLMGWQVLSERGTFGHVAGALFFFMAFAAMTAAIQSLLGRGSQTVTLDANGLRTEGVALRHGEFVDLRAVDPTANGGLLASWTAPPVVVDGKGRVDRGGTIVLGGIAALQGIGAVAAHRQASREVRIEARRQGTGERITLVTGLTADTAVALVGDIGRALQGKGVSAAAAPVSGRPAGPAAANAPPATPLPPSKKVFHDTPEGWRGLMAEAERRGWQTSSGMGGVRFVNRKTGHEVVASRIAEARQQLGI